jgi:DNA repair and recombination protein RAD54 and RAD54-like protein
LSAIALLHTLLKHPGLVDQKRACGLVRTALLVVPVNTEASWQAEFKKWAIGLKPSMLIWLLSEVRPHARSNAIDQWISRGGVFIVSKDSFARAAKAKQLLQSKADIVIVDEAHLALSNRSNLLYKALDCIETKRRILLTGSPFQNNGEESVSLQHYI